jgi:hypothetical protein
MFGASLPKRAARAGIMVTDVHASNVLVVHESGVWITEGSTPEIRSRYFVSTQMRMRTLRLGHRPVSASVFVR